MPQIDLTLRENAPQIAETHEHLTSMATSLKGWSDDVNKERRKALADWQGYAANGFNNAATFCGNGLDDLEHTVTALAQAVDAFHGTVTAVKNTCEGMLDEARKAKLTVNGSIISLPESPTYIGPIGVPLPPDVQKQFSAYEDMEKKFEDLAKRAKEQEEDLFEAHTKLQEACEKVEAPPGVTVTKPKEAGEEAEGIKGILEGLEKGSGLMKGGILAAFGVLGFKGAHTLDWVPNFKDDLQDMENWALRDGAPENAWKVAEGLEKAEPYLKNGAYALTAVSGLLDAKKQWDADSHDPSMNTAEKLGDSVATGVANTVPEAAGAYVGGEAGGEADMEVGGTFGLVLGGPPGAVVGAVLGGTIGTIAGSEVGGAIGKAVGNAAHHVISSIFHHHW